MRVFLLLSIVCMFVSWPSVSVDSFFLTDLKWHFRSEEICSLSCAASISHPPLLFVFRFLVTLFFVPMINAIPLLWFLGVLHLA